MARHCDGWYGRCCPHIPPGDHQGSQQHHDTWGRWTAHCAAGLLAVSTGMSETHDVGGEVQVRERGLSQSWAWASPVERASARDLVVGADASARIHQWPMAAERAPWLRSRNIVSKSNLFDMRMRTQRSLIISWKKEWRRMIWIWMLILAWEVFGKMEYVFVTVVMLHCFLSHIISAPCIATIICQILILKPPGKWMAWNSYHMPWWLYPFCYATRLGYIIAKCLMKAQ